jgi:hypothetical protein
MRAEHWYVYYKLPLSQLDVVSAQVRRMQSTLAGLSVQTSLQMRVDVTDGIATIMECYAGVTDPAVFGPQLDSAVAASDLSPSLRSARRIERFAAL